MQDHDDVITIGITRSYAAAFERDKLPPYSEKPTTTIADQELLATAKAYEKMAALIVANKNLAQTLLQQQLSLKLHRQDRSIIDKLQSAKDQTIDAIDVYALTPVRSLSALSENDYKALVAEVGDQSLYSLLAFTIIVELGTIVYQTARQKDAVSLTKTLEKLATYTQVHTSKALADSTALQQFTIDDVLNIIKNALNKTLIDSSDPDSKDPNKNLAEKYEYRVVLKEIKSDSSEEYYPVKQIRLTKKVKKSKNEQGIAANQVDDATKNLGFWAKVKQEYKRGYAERLKKHQAWLDLQYTKAENNKEANPTQQKPSKARIFCAKVATGFETLWKNPVWKVASTYPIAYWVVWMTGIFQSSDVFSAVMSGGLPLSVPLMFVLPLIPGLIYLAAKAYKYFKKPKPVKTLIAVAVDSFGIEPMNSIESVELVSEDESKAILEISLSVLHQNVIFDIKRKNLKQERQDWKTLLEDYKNKYHIASSTEKNTAAEHDSKSESGIVTEKTAEKNLNETIATPWSRLKNKARQFYLKWMDVVTGAVGGFMWLEFVAWVGQDFFSHVIGLAASPAQSAIITVAVFAASLVFGAAMGIYRWAIGKEQKEQIDIALHNLAEKEREYKQHIADFQQEKQKITKQYKTAVKELDQVITQAFVENNLDKLAELQAIKLKLDKFYKAAMLKLDEDSGSSFRNHTEATSGSKVKTFLKKAYQRTKEFIGRVGTGIFVGRSIFASGGFIPQLAIVAGATATQTGLIAGMSQPVFWAVVLSFGVLFGVLKVVQYHLNKQKARDEKYLADLAARTNVLKLKVDYVKDFGKVITEICGDIKATVNSQLESVVNNNEKKSWVFSAKMRLQIMLRGLIASLGFAKAAQCVQMNVEKHKLVADPNIAQHSVKSLNPDVQVDSRLTVQGPIL